MGEDRKKILLLAFTCSPFKGSESRSGWERALEISREFETWVITESGNEPDITKHRGLHGSPAGLHFLYVKKGRIEERLFGWLPFFYMDYNVWHRRAYRLARILQPIIGFDLAHHLTICGYREPGYLYKLGIPYVWGPLGGMQYYPWRFLSHAGLRGGLIEFVRNVANFLQFRIGPRVDKSLHRARVVLAANDMQRGFIERVHGVNAEVVPDVGIREVRRDSPKNYDRTGPLRILWSGTFEHRKALHLLIRALSSLPEGLEYELRVLGDGIMKTAWRELTARVGVAPHCTWLGWMPHEPALRQNEWADVLVFTSMSDTTGSVLLEALCHGVPVVCFDHCGAADVITDRCGIKLPVTTPEDAVNRLSGVIAGFCRDKTSLVALSSGAIDRAREYLWADNCRRLFKAYDKALGREGDGPPAEAVSVTPVRPAASRPSISVIVINQNREAALTRCLDSIAMQSYRPLEVVVLDHGSTDGSPALIKEFRACACAMGISVRYLSSERMGVAASRNHAAAYARGGLLCFIDNDACFSSPDDLEKAAALFESSSSRALVAFRIMTADTGELDPFAWVFRRPKEIWAERVFKTFTFAGGGFCIRRETFMQAGGFWGHLTYSREEEDLGMALINMGCEMTYFPKVVIRHYFDPSGRYSVAQRRHTELRNGLIVLWRRFPAPIALAAMCARILSMLLRNVMLGKETLMQLASAVPAAAQDWHKSRLQRTPISFRAAFKYFALHLTKEKAG